MTFCTKCGKEIPDDANFCPGCGQPVARSDAPPDEQVQQPADLSAEPMETVTEQVDFEEPSYSAPVQPPQQSYYSQPVQPRSNYNVPPGQQPPNYGYQQRPSYQTGDADAAQNKGLCVLSYFGILLLIPFLMRPNSAYVRYHSNQGLILFICAIIVSILSRIPFLGPYVFSPFGGIFLFVLFIIGLVNTLGGSMKPLPLVGGFTVIK